MAADGTHLDLGSGTAACTAPCEVVLGIRPEHFIQSASGHAAEILAVEPTGTETHIVAHVAGCEVMIALRKCIALRPGDRLTVSAYPAACISSTQIPACASTEKTIMTITRIEPGKFHAWQSRACGSR